MCWNPHYENLIAPVQQQTYHEKREDAIHTKSPAHRLYHDSYIKE
jgi:hypothetical protein